MRIAVTIACWLAVFAAGVLLRFDDLAARPFHPDEATGAKITALRLESGCYQFDPTHYHGPILSLLAKPFCQVAGQEKWADMKKHTLRLLPALAGTLLVLAPLLGRRRWGDGSMLLAAAFLATSPLLVYYSRMFIHESLMALFGVLLVLALFLRPRHGLPGILLGLMFVTKESIAISVIAWAAAAMVLLFENRRMVNRQSIAAAWKEWLMPFALSVITALFVSLVIYTDWGRHLRGAADAARTFFIYEVTEGHEKPFGYYFEMLLLPRKSAGAWWWEGVLLLFAVLAYVSSFGKGAADGKWRVAVRFLAYSAALHFLVYSLIAYKTPWLACLPWAHVCLLAGFGVVTWSRWKMPWKVAVPVLAGLSIAWQVKQTRMATGRLAADARNPYAYVPTSRDIERLLPYLERIGEAVPEIPLEPVAVIGSGYWPLPWYLRSFDHVGYWPQADKVDGELDGFPLIIATPEPADTLAVGLSDTHTPVSRWLRSGYPISVFIRNDIWTRWIEK